MKLSGKQIIGAVVGIALTLVLVALQPFAGLSPEATIVIAVLAGAIAWWVAGVLPDYVTGIIMAVLFVVWAGVPTEVAFGAFATSMWWLLVAAFCLAHAMRASGLLRRMSLGVLRLFPRTFRAQAAGLMAAGMLVGPFVPSLSAKVSMLEPMALAISDEMGYERKGRQANGLFLAVLVGVRNCAPAVLSGSFLGYVVLGLLPESVQLQFDMAHWLLAALPWLIIVTVLNYVALVARYSPKGEGCRADDPVKQNGEAKRADSADAPADAPEGVTGATGATEAAGTVEAAGAAKAGVASLGQPELGPMSHGEKCVLAIMAVTGLLWFTEAWHGIPAFAVALMAVAAMAACGQFKKEDLRSGIAWDVILFVGLVLGLSPSFEYVGANAWVAQICEPVLMMVAGNPYAIVAGVALITVGLRFIVVSETAFINLFMAVAVPLSATLGVNPWIIGFSVYAMVNPWFVGYQNPVYLAGVGAVGDKMTTHGEQALYCGVYVLICLTGLLASVPYWQWLGLA